jgi:hypothetical protein
MNAGWQHVGMASTVAAFPRERMNGRGSLTPDRQADIESLDATALYFEDLRQRQTEIR